MRQIKEEAIRCRQSPLDKAYKIAETGLSIAGMAKGAWEAGQTIYSGVQAIAPDARGAATAISLL